MSDENRLPLTSSIEADARSLFAVPARAEGMSPKALLSALENVSVRHQSLETALRDAGFMPASSEDAPVLAWVDAVFAHWFRHYPLAAELVDVIDHMRPLAAAFAIKDPRFFVPGGHALHRLLDTFHRGLTGWHAQLGGSSNNALEGLKDAVERARRDFPSEPRVDATLERFDQKIRGHAAQLERLDQVLLDRETATLGDEIATLSTAVTINDLLATHQVPGSVARFLKSDWFDSGTLVAKRYGLNSDEWRNFISTSQLLVDAVQPVAMEDAEGQQRLQQTMQQLPSTLSRQLRHLEPDKDTDAVGLIEYALLRNMRGEDLNLLFAEPIQVRGMPEFGPPTDEDLQELHIRRGAWYLVQTPDGEVRLRLAGGLVSNLFLVFMDFTGARAMRKSYNDFSSMLRSGEARVLDNADCFCRSMVEAVTARRDAQPPQQQTPDTESWNTEPAPAPAPEPTDQAAVPEPDTASSSEDPDPPQEQRWPQDPPAEPRTDVSTTGRNDNDAMPSTDQPYDSNTVVKLQIPMGTWMGFHDRDPPLMARVAVRDLEKDSYIFTNREGIKLRELTVAQLIALIDRDMVDILERKTNFRETVAAMRRDQERLN